MMIESENNERTYFILLQLIDTATPYWIVSVSQLKIERCLKDGVVAEQRRENRRFEKQEERIAS